MEAITHILGQIGRGQPQTPAPAAFPINDRVAAERRRRLIWYTLAWLAVAAVMGTWIVFWVWAIYRMARWL